MQAPPAQTGLALPTPIEDRFVTGTLAQIIWYHHVTILDKVKCEAERLFYIRQTAESGWSRNVLVHLIESRLYGGLDVLAGQEIGDGNLVVDLLDVHRLLSFKSVNALPLCSCRSVEIMAA